MDNIKIIKTKDGSHTLYLSGMDETYHSNHGAIQEAKHVFIKNGIQLIKKNKIRVLEVGFGTGLNAILTSEFAKNEQKQIEYVGLETIPLGNELISGLNYLEQEPTLSKKDFTLIHESQWEKTNRINTNFYLTKRNNKVQDFNETDLFDIVYYDAFGPRAQIEMWEKSIFEKLFNRLDTGGILVTYCAMGQFKRDLKEVGFEVKNVPGPPGKREMTIAIKKTVL